MAYQFRNTWSVTKYATNTLQYIVLSLKGMLISTAERTVIAQLIYLTQLGLIISLTETNVLLIIWTEHRRKFFIYK